MEFTPFGKIGRINRETIITEKLDGTNASVYIPEPTDPDQTMLVGSRKQWITPERDNHGFAKWAYEHEDQLRLLGPGRHFGEWWGSGIQRGYGLKGKRFSLFNVQRWTPEGDFDIEAPVIGCCHVVPTLARLSRFDTNMIDAIFYGLKIEGSIAAPGYMKPEGIIVYHPQSRQSFKWTFEKDDHGKNYGS